MIGQAAGLTLAVRWGQAIIAAFLLLTCYWPNVAGHHGVPVALVFAVYFVFTAIAAHRYHRGAYGPAFVVADVVVSLGTLLLAAHYAEGVYGPILYLVPMTIITFIVVFGPGPGNFAMVAGAGGLALQAVLEGTGLWAMPPMAAGGFRPAIDVGTMLAVTALLLIGSRRTTDFMLLTKDELSNETARARAHAAFQAGLAELALAVLGCDGLAETLTLVAERAHTLVGCGGAMICLVEGDTLAVRAFAPGGSGLPLDRFPVSHETAATARSARERGVVLGEVDGMLPELVARGFRRALALPLQGRSGAVLGTLTFLDDGAPRDLETLRVQGQLLASGAVTALEQAALMAHAQQESRRVHALLAVSQEIGHRAPYQETQAAICRLTRRLLGADRATVLRWEAEGKRFVPAAQDGMSPAEAARWRGLPVPLDPSPASVPPAYRPALAEGRLIATPLHHAGEIYGLLTAGRNGGTFDGAQVALLEGIARQASMALDNLRLHEEEREAATLATTLLDVARELNLALDPPALLSRLAARAVELTRADVALIAIWQGRDQRYRIEGVHGLSRAEAERVLHAALAGDAYRGWGDTLRLDRAELSAAVAGLDLLAGVSADLTVPMEWGGNVVGALTLLWRSATLPAQRQTALAQGLCNQAAIALQNARLVEDLREASRLKSDFVATMSHELRTPLNVIMGYTDLLLEDAFGTIDPEQKNILGRIQRSARELFELITATLDLNRLEAGRSRVTVETVAVPDLFAQLEAEAASRLDTGGIELRFHLATDLPPLETDRSKLRIVLKNLIGNAIKFTERGNVTIHAEPADDAVVFTVQDTGIGIRREDLPIIFEMFRQVEGHSTRRHGGVGLGLYIVKRLLAELRGDIDVQSEVGAGTRFRVRVPVRLAA